jgi:hypothetical protein
MQRVGLTVCRGRRCTAAGERREINQIAPRARLEGLADAGYAALRDSSCLSQCRQANVVVVRPALTARIKGERPVWIGPLEDEVLPRLETWIRAGGPGRAPLPDALSARVITPKAACT